MILPTAPKSFYDPSLNEIRNKLLAQNGSTIGQIALITAPPVAIETAWAEVGSGNNSDPSNDVGTLVIGVANITTISEPVEGPEEVVGEYGYKLQFGAIPEVQIKIDDTGTTTAVIVGAALIVGRDTFDLGSDADVRYIAKIKDLTVTDGSIISLPDWELIINYAKVPEATTNITLVVNP